MSFNIKSLYFCIKICIQKKFKMKKLISTLIYLAIFAIFSIRNVHAQCNWQTVLTDSYEYQTPCPDLIPGTTVHVVPQSWAVHSGTYSLYMNFINCNGGTGACPGDTIYKRHLSVCKNMPYRFSTYLATSFGGIQCNVKIVITDGNGTVLNMQPAINADYFPVWTLYNSGTVTSTTSDMYFILITNVGGAQGGNDLSMDDFMLEQCYPTSTASSTTGNICSNLTQQNLFDFLIPGSDTTGTWSGPAPLTGGYLGTFSVATSPSGSYIYSSPYYGTVAGCPLTTDTVITSIIPGPSPYLGNDTTICSNQSIMLNAAGGVTYLWNTGEITSSIIASTTVLSGDTIDYSVVVTTQNGCSGSDSIQIIFMNCTSVDELGYSENIGLYPNPAKDYLSLGSKNIPVEQVDIIDQSGRIVKSIENITNGRIYVGDLAKAVYIILVYSEENIWSNKFIKAD